MGLVIILFAFTLSLVINFIERIVHSINDTDSNSSINNEQFVVEESENNKESRKAA